MLYEFSSLESDSVSFVMDLYTRPYSDNGGGLDQVDPFYHDEESRYKMDKCTSCGSGV